MRYPLQHQYTTTSKQTTITTLTELNVKYVGKLSIPHFLVGIVQICNTRPNQGWMLLPRMQPRLNGFLTLEPPRTSPATPHNFSIPHLTKEGSRLQLETARRLKSLMRAKESYPLCPISWFYQKSFTLLVLLIIYCPLIN